jgi:nicotinamide mononucleotide adenylyltransferase
MQNVLAKASSKSGQWAMFIGRWQPWHDGHRWLIDQALNEDKKVLLCIRDVPTDEKNPWSAIEIMYHLSNQLMDLIEQKKLKIIIIPDIESINIGRGVGYDVIEHIPPAEIHDISATKIREQMKAEGRL